MYKWNKNIYIVYLYMFIVSSVMSLIHYLMLLIMTVQLNWWSDPWAIVDYSN